MDIKSAGILGGCIVIAALILSLVHRSVGGPEAATTPGPTARLHSPDGGLVVDFQVHTSPSSTEGSKIEGITDIEFYGSYILVKTKQGGGMIFFNERTRSLSWYTAAPRPERQKQK
jgi:hypothetical protein